MGDIGRAIGDTLICMKAAALGQIEKVARLEQGDLVVDTCVAPDTGKFETGISHPDYDEGHFIIVEEYEDEEAAKEGHERWVAAMTASELPDELLDVDLWGIGLEPYRRKELQDG